MSDPLLQVSDGQANLIAKCFLTEMEQRADHMVALENAKELQCLRETVKTLQQSNQELRATTEELRTTIESFRAAGDKSRTANEDLRIAYDELRTRLADGKADRADVSTLNSQMIMMSTRLEDMGSILSQIVPMEEETEDSSEPELPAETRARENMHPVLALDAQYAGQSPDHGRQQGPHLLRRRHEAQHQQVRSPERQTHLADYPVVNGSPTDDRADYTSRTHDKEPPQDAVKSDQAQSRVDRLKHHYSVTKDKYAEKNLGKDQRRYIWSFIEDFKDDEFSSWFQNLLLEKFPEKAHIAAKRGSKKTGGRHIALSMDMTWEDVRRALKNVDPPAFMS